MDTVYSPAHALHAPAREFLDGQLIPYFESPSRAEIIRDAVEAAGLGAIVAPDDFGLELTIVKYEWVPRTGNLEVTAKVDCASRVWSASWAPKIGQRVSAKGFQKISCTGEPQRLTLVLDPKNGRFHPGAAAQKLTTIECISDFCAGLVYPESDIRIPPPGQSHARGAR